MSGMERIDGNLAVVRRVWRRLTDMVDRFHLVRAVGSLAMAAVLIGCWLTMGGKIGAPVPEMTPYVIAMAAVLVLGAAFPTVAGMAMAVLTIVMTILFGSPVGGSPMVGYDPLLWSLMWSMGVMGYAAEAWLSVPTVIVAVGSFLMPYGPLAFMMMPYFVDFEEQGVVAAAFLLGVTLRLNRTVREQYEAVMAAERIKAQQKEYEELKRRVSLQRVIHDSVAGALSYLVLATRPEAAEPERATLNRKAREALAATRQAIALLQSVSEETDRQTAGAEAFNGKTLPIESGLSAPTIPDSSRADLAEQADHWRQDLASLGLNGDVTLDLPRHLPEDIQTLLGDALNMACTNIAVHAARGGAYEVKVAASGEEIWLDAVNDIDGSAPDPVLTSGTGLESLRVRLAESGGTLDVIPTPRFHLHIELPFSSRQPRE